MLAAQLLNRKIHNNVRGAQMAAGVELLLLPLLLGPLRVFLSFWLALLTLYSTYLVGNAKQ